MKTKIRLRVMAVILTFAMVLTSVQMPVNAAETGTETRPIGTHYVQVIYNSGTTYSWGDNGPKSLWYPCYTGTLLTGYVDTVVTLSSATLRDTNDPAKIVVGWVCDYDNQEYALGEDFELGQHTNSLTFTAVWDDATKYSVKYYDGDECIGTDYSDTGEITLRNALAEKKDATFLYWQVKDGDTTYKAGTTVTDFNSDLVLVAKWKAQYVVNFIDVDASNPVAFGKVSGTSGSVGIPIICESDDNCDDLTHLPNGSTYFVGWISEDGKTTYEKNTEDKDLTVKVSGSSKNIYVLREYPVTFKEVTIEANGRGDKTITVQAYLSLTGTATETAPDAAKKEGYKLLGWSITDPETASDAVLNDLVDLKVGDEISVSSAVTYYPVWTKCNHDEYTLNTEEDKDECVVCGYIKDHDYQPDDNGDTHTCKDCGKYADHEYVADENGETHTCDICDDTQNHDFTVESDTTHYCEICEKSYPHTGVAENHECDNCEYKQAAITYVKSYDNDKASESLEPEYVDQHQANASSVTVDSTVQDGDDYYRFVKWVEGDERDATGLQDGIVTTKTTVTITPTLADGNVWGEGATYTAVYELAKAIIVVGDDVYTSWDEVPEDAEKVTVIVKEPDAQDDPVITGMLDELQDGEPDDITLDLNGQTLDLDDEDTPIVVEEGDTLTIIDSDPDNEGTLDAPIIVENDGTLNIEGGTITSDEGTPSDEADGLTAVIVVEEGGNLTLEGGNVEGDPEKNVIGIIVEPNPGVVELKEGEVTGGATIPQEGDDPIEIGAILYVTDVPEDGTPNDRLDELIPNGSALDGIDDDGKTLIDELTDDNKAYYTTDPTAKFEYKATFYEDDTDKIRVVTLSAEKNGTVTAPVAPNRPGYIFLGWYKEGDPDTLYEEEMSVTITEPTNFYGKWKECDHSGTFTSNGDTHICDTCKASLAHEYQPYDATNHICKKCGKLEAHKFNGNVCSVAGCTYTQPTNPGSGSGSGSGSGNTTTTTTTPTTTTTTTTSTPAAASADEEEIVAIGAQGSGASTASSASTGKTVSVSKSFLHLKAIKATKTTQTLVWTKANGATGYMIYGAKCGEKKYKLLKTIKSAKTLTWKRTGLEEGTYYKYKVVAYKLNSKGKKVKLATSNTAHSVTVGSKLGNPQRVTVDLETLSVTVKVKKKVTISAETIYKESKTASLAHAALIRYRSSDTSIATVGKKTGVIKGKKAGTCYIYCYGVNGVYKKVKVTVTKK